MTPKRSPLPHWHAYQHCYCPGLVYAVLPMLDCFTAHFLIIFLPPLPWCSLVLQDLWCRCIDWDGLPIVLVSTLCPVYFLWWPPFAVKRSLLSAYHKEEESLGLNLCLEQIAKGNIIPWLWERLRSIALPGSTSITGHYASLWAHSRSYLPGNNSQLLKVSVPPLPSLGLVGNHIPRPGSHADGLMLYPVHFLYLLSVYCTGKSENREETSLVPKVLSLSKTREWSSLVLASNIINLRK